jgi:galactose mutarotase-like enzyme
VHELLTDVDNNVWQDAWTTEGNSGDVRWGVQKTTLRGGQSDRVDVVQLDNGAFSVSVLPTRGMGLWKASYRGIPVEWRSPVARPVHPQLVNLEARNGLGWLSGFNELMCRCGLSFNGPPGVDRVIDNDGNPVETPMTLHGKIANSPAHHVSVDVDENTNTLSVTGIVDEAMMFGPVLQLKSTVSTQVGSNTIRVEDTVTNKGGQATELELLYHTNLGRPFLEAGSKLVAPIKEMAPRDAIAAQADDWMKYQDPVAGFVEECYFFDLESGDDDQTSVMLHNSAGDKAVVLSFQKTQLPCFTLWKNTQAEADGYVTGLEPSTNYPNLKTYEREQGRVISLEPAESYSTAFELTVLDNANDVATQVATIQSLQKSPVIHDIPQARFSG